MQMQQSFIALNSSGSKLVFTIASTKPFRSSYSALASALFYIKAMAMQGKQRMPKMEIMKTHKVYGTVTRRHTTQTIKSKRL